MKLLSEQILLLSASAVEVAVAAANDKVIRQMLTGLTQAVTASSGPSQAGSYSHMVRSFLEQLEASAAEARRAADQSLEDAWESRRLFDT